MQAPADTTNWMMSVPVSKAIRVAIVDDNKSTRQSLADVLSYSPKTIVSLAAGSGDEFMSVLRKLPVNELPQVVLMDINMPGINGIETVRHSKTLHPEMLFVMLTSFDDEDTLFEAIRAGASGYLLKAERAAEIITHIENLVDNGSAPMSPIIARKTLDLLATSSKPLPETQIAELGVLSSREKDVLSLLVDGLEYRNIGERLHISPHTVRKHISNIYEKLHISSKAQAIRLMQGTPAAADTAEKHKILLVDDHQIILDSLAMMMNSFRDVEVIGRISQPRQVIEFMKKHPVDLLVTDIHMPDMDGLQLASLVRHHFPSVRILMLTVSESMEEVKEAKRIGVEGYVLKKANKEELHEALKAIMAGKSFYSQSLQFYS